MSTSERPKFIALMVLQLLWGLVLWFSISKLGLGVSTDSVHLLSGAQNLAASGRLISFDGTRLLEWPPLYPALLALLHLTGMSTFAAAHVLQVLAYLVISVSLGLLFLRIFPDLFPLAFAGCLLSQVGAVMVAGFDMLGSDYLHLALVLLCCALIGEYLSNGSPRVYVGIAVAGMLAMLARFLGIAVIAAAALSIFLWGAGNFKTRLLRGVVLLLVGVPATVWLLVTSPLVGRRAPITFGENFRWFSRSILEWFFAPDALKPYLTLWIALLWIVIAVLVVVAWRARLPSPAKIIFLFGVTYLLALFGTAFIAYYNKLGGRFILPLFVPFIALLLMGLRSLIYAAERVAPPAMHLVGLAGWVTLAVLLLRVSYPVIVDSHNGVPAGENVFNTAEWRSNDAVRYWLAHPPQGEYRLFSNLPDGVAFYAAHACEPSPRQFSGPYGKTEFPVESYGGSLFTPGQDTYLLWIEPNPYDYYYSPQDLKPAARVHELFSGAGGGVYKLSPKSQQ